MELRLPVFILRDERTVLAAVTENVSSQGLCFTSQERLAPGERLVCVLRLTIRRKPNESPVLRFQAEVVWVRMIADGRFGVGCRIDDYRMVM